MSQEILSKFAQLQTENRNQKQELKRYSQMLLARDEEITKLKKQIDDYQLGEKMVAKNQSYLEAKAQKDIDQVKQNQKLQQRKDNETKTTNRRKSKGGFKNRRNDCIESFLNENKAMDYSQGGIKKEYYTVATRHSHFAKYFPEHRINTDLIEVLCNDKQVATKTTIFILVKNLMQLVWQWKNLILDLLIKQVH